MDEMTDEGTEARREDADGLLAGLGRRSRLIDAAVRRGRTSSSIFPPATTFSTTER